MESSMINRLQILNGAFELATVNRRVARIDEWGNYLSKNVCFATEGPLVRDGAQTTAFADLSGATSGLSGFQSSGQFLAVKICGSRQVQVASGGGDAIYGILQNKPAAGQAADVGIMGVSKAVG